MSAVDARPQSSTHAWVLACRPATLAAAVVPVAVGTACAHAVGSLRAAPALAALAGAVLIQIGTNLANDVFDHEKGADTGERLGPTRVVSAGLLSARAVRRAMWIAFGAAALVGVYLAAVGGPAIVVLGVASVASGLAYTSGPYPLGYHGLGDVFVLAFFGFVAVCWTALVQVGGVPDIAWWASVPVGCLATAILVVNNVRDRDTDVKAGKRTLAVRFGRRAAVAQYRLLLGVAFATPVALVAAARTTPWALLPLATAPLGVKLAREISARDGRSLNATLTATARLLLAFGLLLATGIAVGR